jgi:hypothetical protein
MGATKNFNGWQRLLVLIAALSALVFLGIFVVVSPRHTPLLPETERDLSPADLWEAKVAQGFSADLATRYVGGIYGLPKPDSGRTRRIQENVEAMRAQGANESDVLAYLRMDSLHTRVYVAGEDWRRIRDSAEAAHHAAVTRDAGAMALRFAGAWVAALVFVYLLGWGVAWTRAGFHQSKSSA